MFTKETISRAARFKTLLPAVFTTAILFAACNHNSVDPQTPAILPTILSVRADSNTHNVLSAIVTARSNNADELAVEYGLDSLFKQQTPFVPVTGDSTRIPVLGLEASRSYAMRVVAVSVGGDKTNSKPFPFNTSKLPDDLPRVSVVSRQSPAAGFVMMGFASSETPTQFYATIVDNDGKIVWYKGFGSGVVDFQKQANGNFTAYASLPGAPPHFYEFDQLGNIIREYRASNGMDTGPHELRLLNGGYCLFGIQFRPMDFTAVGGAPNASVRGTVIEYYRDNASPLLWNPFDYFNVSDAASDVALTAASINPWHGNAIDIDADGNLLVSFRNSDEITKINSRTGQIIWRLGGKKNQFTFVNDRLNGFSHQHGIRRLPNGNIILFDNGNLHAPPESRAVEYKLDEQAKTAELVWEYRHAPALYGFALGFAQRLANGNTLISFGTSQRVIEVDRSGTKQWELAILGSQVFNYRAFRIESLY